MEFRVSTPFLPTGRDVLVVEDELRIRNMLSRALKEMGFQATLAPSAEAALRAISQQAFDILILDLNLPGMSGMDFLEAMRKKHPDIQVIILTGFGDLESAKRAIHLDVVEFLTKPCGLGNLEVALDRARKRRKGQIVGDATASAEPMRQFESEPDRQPMTAHGAATLAAPADESGRSLEDLEERHILSVLKKHNGNRAATAADLGISLRKLYYRLGEYHKKGLIP